MKYFYTLVSMLFISVVLVCEADAQIFKRLKDKAKEKLESKAEQKIDAEMEKAADRMVDKSWNAIFGEMAEGGNPMGNLPFKLNSNVTTEPVYHFDIISTMEIQNKHKDGSAEPPLYMDMHYREGATYTGTKFRGEQMDENQGSLFIIYDFKNSAMVMLMENDKDKFSFTYGWEQVPPTANEVRADSAQEIKWDEVNEWEGYKKIGTKNIAGYDCDGYRLDGENGSTELWVTRQADFGMQDMFQANANAKQLKGKIPENYPYGTLMEMTSTDLSTGDTTSMKVTQVQKNAAVNYVMADYPNMSLKMKKDD